MQAARIMIFFFNDTATTEIYTLSLHDALPICLEPALQPQLGEHHAGELRGLLKHRPGRSEEHTSELQSHSDLVCRLLLEQTTTRHSTRFSRGPGAHWPPGMTHCSCTPSTRCLT